MGIAPDKGVWVNRHVMIAFTTMMWAAETLGYDTAPMEGFVESKVRQVLGIPDHVRVVALLAIGHRKGEGRDEGRILLVRRFNGDVHRSRLPIRSLNPRIRRLAGPRAQGRRRVTHVPFL